MGRPELFKANLNDWVLVYSCKCVCERSGNSRGQDSTWLNVSELQFSKQRAPGQISAGWGRHEKQFAERSTLGLSLFIMPLPAEPPRKMWKISKQAPQADQRFTKAAEESLVKTSWDVRPRSASPGYVFIIWNNWIQELFLHYWNPFWEFPSDRRLASWSNLAPRY